MRIACHIRHHRQLERLEEIPDHLMTFYASDASQPAPRRNGVPLGPCTRLYVGDEFCVARMPALPSLQRISEAALSMGVALTLLTPVMTDREISRIAPLFDYLKECHPQAEVVFNEWGVMGWLQSDYPALRLSAGRVLNKGFKDPRLKPDPAGTQESRARPDALLDGSTFDGRWIQDHLQARDISRWEKDLLPYQTIGAWENNGFQTSIYFPFGYVTSGRTCWVASFDQPPEKHFLPPDRCSRPCRQGMLELKSEAFDFRIFQSGNTIFYLYPLQRLDRLLQTASAQDTRLVYQGFGIDA